MTWCRVLTLMLVPCIMAGCAQQSSHAPPAASASERTTPPEPTNGTKPAPTMIVVPGPENTGVAPDSLSPKPGDYIYVEELPEAITRAPLHYPDEARKHGIQGTVMGQCLILRDGTVGDVRIVKSVPGLDEAAAACLRQWRRPAPPR